MDNDVKVMVVEDNELDMAVITSALGAAGINYRAVSDSRQALQTAIDFQPSIAILDIHMPELDGKQVREQLHTHTKTNHIKVIFLSAEESTHGVLYGLNLHFSGYFQKGVRICHIIDSIMTLDGGTKMLSSINAFSALSQRIADKYAVQAH